jgi:hypothetical protein
VRRTRRGGARRDDKTAAHLASKTSAVATEQDGRARHRSGCRGRRRCARRPALAENEAAPAAGRTCASANSWRRGRYGRPDIKIDIWKEVSRYCLTFPVYGVYGLQVTVYRLLRVTINSLLSTVSSLRTLTLQSTVYSLLFTVYSLLFTVYCLLLTAYCLLLTVYCLRCKVYCLQFTVYSLLARDYSLLLKSIVYS